MAENRIVVTIDGPAGAGKSTIAKRLARALDYRLLDTGALYRLVALLADRRGVGFDDAPALASIAADLDMSFAFKGEENRIFAGQEDVSAGIREPRISTGASVVSAHPAVRDALLGLQRRLGAEGGVVVEGRDTGTVVFPDAEAKFFLTASVEVRAERRHAELVASGRETTLEAVRAEIRARDERDSGRAVAPLVPASDAVHVDSSAAAPDEVVGQMLAVVKARAENPKPGV